MSFRQSFILPLRNWLSYLGVGIRAAATTGWQENDRDVQIDDSEFDGGWRGNSLATDSSASRYPDGHSGYLTRNGKRSLEIGAADD